MIVISDTTPIISLMKAGRLNILKDLFQEIYIPNAVYEELVSNERYRKEAEEIESCTFITVTHVKDKRAVDLIRRIGGLDLGESEAIVLTEDMNASLLLMDEAKGRNVARSLGLNITGTIGLLMEAFEENILSAEDIVDCVDNLRKSNRHIAERYLQKLIDITKQ